MIDHWTMPPVGRRCNGARHEPYLNVHFTYDDGHADAVGLSVEDARRKVDQAYPDWRHRTEISATAEPLRCYDPEWCNA